MNLLCLILLVSAVVLWFSFAEYDSLFGVYYPTCAIRHRNFLPVVFAFMCVAIIFSTYSGISDTVSDDLYNKFNKGIVDNAIDNLEATKAIYEGAQ